MASAHALRGLMKWLGREEWQPAFAAHLELHLGPACDKAGVAIDDLPAVLDEHWSMTLWGCAFEDFLARELDDGRNIVDDYLKRRGWKENAPTKAYMAALRSSAMSLYEVSGIVVGESFLARDLVRGGEPVRVNENAATHSLKQWDRIAARLLRVGSKTVIGGGSLPFDHDLGDAVLTVLRRAFKRVGKESAQLALALGPGFDEAKIAAATTDAGMLRLAAPLFSTLWLAEYLERALNPQMPEMSNSDGEELLFTTLRYPLKPGTAAEDIRAVLRAIPALRQESDTFWNWVEAEPRAPARPTATGAKSGQRFTSILDDGSIVLGNVELKDAALHLSVNSRGRAERGRALFEAVLQGRVGEPLVETQTVDDLVASQPAGGAKQRPLGLSPEDERAAIHETLDRHYTKLLDEPIPILGNKTPRAAARTAKGRAKLAAWLKLIENHATQLDAGDPMAGYDVRWLWEKLGVLDLRR